MENFTHTSFYFECLRSPENENQWQLSSNSQLYCLFCFLQYKRLFNEQQNSLHKFCQRQGFEKGESQKRKWKWENSGSEDDRWEEVIRQKPIWIEDRGERKMTEVEREREASADWILFHCAWSYSAELAKRITCYNL